MQEIFADARAFMRENGNPDQWGDRFPTQEMLDKLADYYDEENPKLINPNETSADLVPLGIGRNVTMEHCIIDKNVRIGDGVIIRRQPCDLNSDGENYYIRDGITVIPKGATLLPGTVI